MEVKSKAEITRGKILTAALALFAHKGFNATTTKEIAQEAGVAEGTIFRYFPTKKDLLYSLYHPGMVEGAINTVPNMEGMSTRDILKKMVAERYSTISGKKDLFLLMLNEMRFHPELKEYAANNIILKAVQLVEKFLEGKMKTGEFKEVNPAIAARSFIGMFMIFIAWGEIFGLETRGRFEQEEIIDVVAEIFLNGILEPND